MNDRPTTNVQNRASSFRIDPPTDLDRERVAMHAASCKRTAPGGNVTDRESSELADGIHAGHAGEALADLWGCSRKEAFDTAVRLAFAGQFRFHLHQRSYAVNFSPVTFNEPDEIERQGMSELPMLLEELADGANTEEPFRYQDRPGKSPAMALLVAFGKVETRGDFELYPADVDPFDDSDESDASA